MSFISDIISNILEFVGELIVIAFNQIISAQGFCAGVVYFIGLAVTVYLLYQGVNNFIQALPRLLIRLVQFSINSTWQIFIFIVTRIFRGLGFIFSQLFLR